MAVARPGVQKLNIPKLQSPKASIAANLGSASRSTGVSYGIFAQRTLTGSGIHLNNRAFNGASISATRHALNDNRTVLFNNIGMPYRCNHDQGNNTMNKFMAGMMAMNMLAQMGAQTAAIIKEAKAAKAENNGNVKKDTGIDGAGDAVWKKQFGADELKLTSELKAAKTFASINQVEAKANEQLRDFQRSYAETTATTQAAISNALDANIQATLTDLGVTLDPTKLKASTLNINVDDLSTIDPALQTIDKDIQTATKFLDTDVTQAISKLDSELGTVSASLTSLEQQKASIELKPADQRTEAETQFLAQYDQKHQELQTKKENIQKALDAINGQNGVKSLVEGLIKTLGEKQTSLADIKQVKTDMADRKYQVAEQLQKDIKNTQDRLDSLDGKIAKAKNNEDKNKLIDEFNGLVDKLAGFKTDLNIAGNKPITNSKGKPIDLSKVTIKSYTKKVKVQTGNQNSTPVTPNPVSGGGQTSRMFSSIQSIVSNLPATDPSSCKVGQKIVVKDVEFTKTQEGTFTATVNRQQYTYNAEEMDDIFKNQIDIALPYKLVNQGDNLM